MVDLVTGVIIGIFIYYLLLQIKNNNRIKSNNKIFIEVYNEILYGRSVFLNRINNLASVEVSIKSTSGPLVLYFTTDKKNLSLFIGDKCVYTQHDIDSKVIDNIYEELYKTHGNYINKIYTITNTVLVDEKTFSKLSQGVNNDLIINIDNDSFSYSLDDILDRINDIGYDNLSPAEKKYLDKYGKNK